MEYASVQSAKGVRENAAGQLQNIWALKSGARMIVGSCEDDRNITDR